MVDVALMQDLVDLRTKVNDLEAQQSVLIGRVNTLNDDVLSLLDKIAKYDAMVEAVKAIIAPPVP